MEEKKKSEKVEEEWWKSEGEGWGRDEKERDGEKDEKSNEQFRFKVYESRSWCEMHLNQFRLAYLSSFGDIATFPIWAKFFWTKSKIWSFLKAGKISETWKATPI